MTIDYDSMSSSEASSKLNKNTNLLKRVAVSTFEPVSVQRAKHNSNIPDSEKAFDSFLQDCIKAARDYIERQLGCCICEATYTLSLGKFPAYAIPIPVWPVQSVESIAYKDTDNANQTVTFGTIVQPVSDDRYTIYLTDWASFPTARSTPNAITISFTAGWASQEVIPPSIARAVLMLVSYWYEFRETVSIGVTTGALEFSVNALLDSVRPGEDNLE
jgi:uncharacterized phiE125 gp8 family phage protein